MFDAPKKKFKSKSILILNLLFLAIFIKFVEYLIITLPRIYSQELTSYSKMLQEMGKVILNRGQNPQGSSLLNPPPEQN